MVVVVQFLIDEYDKCWCYGYNNYGQLAINSNTNLSSTVEYPTILSEKSLNIQKLMFGYKYNVFILTNDNEIYQYGKNVYDMFGFKSDNDIYQNGIRLVHELNYYNPIYSVIIYILMI